MSGVIVARRSGIDGRKGFRERHNRCTKVAWVWLNELRDSSTSIARLILSCVTRVPLF